MGGMSTNVMRGKIEEIAKKEHTEMMVKAIGMDELDNYIESVDAVLLGPQIRYNADNIRAQLDEYNPAIPMMVIDSSDFGMMRGEHVYQQLMTLLKQ